MNMTEYLEKMKKIQKDILEYIDDEEDSEDKFQNIIDIIKMNKIEDNQDELKIFLSLLTKISNNHHRNANFFSKMDRILEYLKDSLLKFFSNSELFHIFGSSKRILLFLVESKMMVIDEFVAKQMVQGKYFGAKYHYYFQPEIRPFSNEKWFTKYAYEIFEEEEEKNTEEDGSDSWFYDIIEEVPEHFYELRKIGENNDFICELIRKDSIDDFIVCMSKNNYQFNSAIKLSIYETNNFLLKRHNRQPKLIEYAAFFGSIQIFNYLRNKGAKLTPSLWNYAIHGNNAEIIQILEDSKVKPKNKKTIEKILKESIKCHHNEMADYIQSNFLVKENEEEKESKYEVVYCLKYRNFKFINNEQINGTTFNYLCRYDYYTLVSILLNTMDIDINHQTIYKIIHFSFNFKIYYK